MWKEERRRGKRQAKKKGCGDEWRARIARNCSAMFDKLPPGSF